MYAQGKMSKFKLHLVLAIQVSLSLFQGGNGFCWKPNTTPFNGPPKATQVCEREKRVRVDWSAVFNSGDGCESVDFLIMTHPSDNPSAYTLSDFTLKGQRSATLQLEGDGDYVFQVRIKYLRTFGINFYDDI